MRFVTPLIGIRGMMKNRVMNRIPCFLIKPPTMPHLPQRICSGVACEPQVKKCVPIMKKKAIIWVRTPLACSSQILAESTPEAFVPNLLPVVRTLFHVWVGPLHPTLRPVQRNKSELLVKAVSVFRR